MGKYDEVTTRLEKLIPDHTPFREKVLNAKIDILENYPKPSALSSHYAMLRESKRKIEEELSRINVLIEASSELITEQYEDEGISTIKLDDGSSVRTQFEPYAQVVNKEEFRLWCVSEGFEKQMSLPWQTTNSLTKELLVEGRPEPPGVKAYIKSKVVYTRAKKTK